MKPHRIPAPSSDSCLQQTGTCCRAKYEHASKKRGMGLGCLAKNPSWHLQRHERELEQTQPYKEPQAIAVAAAQQQPTSGPD